MSRVPGGFLKGLDHHFFHLGVVYGTRRTRPWFIPQAIKPPLREPSTLFGHRRDMTTQLGGYVHIRHALRRSQHHPATQRQRLTCRMPPRPTPQRLPFLIAQLDNHRLTPPPSTHHLTSQTSIVTIPQETTTKRGEIEGQDTSSRYGIWWDSSYFSRWRSLWSPEGNHVLYKVAVQDGIELWIGSADGSEPRQLTTYGYTDGSWSPDGSQILYHITIRDENDEVAGNEVWTVDSDGNNPRPQLLPAVLG